MMTIMDPALLPFRQLCEAEPRLFELWMEASTIRPYPEHAFCTNHLWAVRFKPRLTQLVGWQADKPSVRTVLDYDIGYTYLYYALPECCHEGMCW